MKLYKVVFSERALKQLKKIDSFQSELIYRWIEKNLDGCENPRTSGKALVGDKRGYWRYRVGVYRIISSIEDDVLKIELVNVGHRKDIYK